MPDLRRDSTNGRVHSTHSNWVINGTTHQNTTLGVALMVALSYAVGRYNETPEGEKPTISLDDCPEGWSVDNCTRSLKDLIHHAKLEVAWPVIRTNKKGMADDTSNYMALMNPRDWLAKIWRECLIKIDDVLYSAQIAGIKKELTMLADQLNIPIEDRVWLEDGAPTNSDDTEKPRSTIGGLNPGPYAREM